ncbi:MAG: two-component system, OmpR family, phosphate regulon sensor histidine kinase PhoR [Frankiaceae bacterium]|nr:two-component system, OmpR family, phosphate regulon sensor histidine kinase PhoR [Frankiaceae bacterium]
MSPADDGGDVEEVADSETDRVIALAARWAEALLGNSFVPLSRQETEQQLLCQLRELLDLHGRENFVAEPARRVGAWLVDAHFVAPSVVATTLEVLAEPPVDVPSSEGSRQRWTLLLGALAEGFAARLVDRVRREQQEIVDAAFVAREQTQQELRRSERRLEQAREDFITTVSHELKTPLTPIKGYLHTLLNREGSLSAAQRARCYRIMLDQAELLTGLVQDLLGAAELQHVGFTVRPQVVEARDVIDRALEVMPPDTGREFSFRGDEELGLVRCDPVRLRQVLTNLLTNADKYSPPERPVHVCARRESAMVHIAVRDFGAGIAPEFRTAIFEPFRRLGAGTQRGAGLGLHIARRLVEAMGGEIWLDPDTEPGAMFRLTVPAVPDSRPERG